MAALLLMRPIIAAIIFSCYLVLASSSSDVIQWIKVPNDELPHHRGLEVIGVENGKKLYLGQVTHNQTDRNEVYRYPGKLQFGNEINTAVVAWGVEYAYSDFLILDAPPGSLSWTSWKVFPDNAVIGGTTLDEAICYICRVPHSNGNLVPGWLRDDGTCFYGFNGTEYMVGYDYEYLAINQLGMAMGVKNILLG